MVARRNRKKKPSRRSKTKGVSLIGLAETYLLANAVTMAMFRTNPIQFAIGAPAPGSTVITARELFNPAGRFYDIPDVTGVQGPMYYIRKNLMREKGGGFTAVVQLITIPLLFKLGKNLTRVPVNRTNKLLGDVGIGNTVKL